MNLFVGFRAVFTAPAGERVRVRVAASSLYRFFVNGEFRGHGPARGPHDYYRVDVCDITGTLKPGLNVVAFEVAGYNVNSYYLLDQPAFLQAEVITDSSILASTAGPGAPFEATILDERVRKVQRYSFQRTFSEVYRLKPGWDRWRRDPMAPFQPVECSVAPAKTLLPRGVPYPEFAMRQPVRHESQGGVRRVAVAGRIWKDRSLTAIGPMLKGFKEEELDVIPSIELQHFETLPSRQTSRPASWQDKLALGTNTYHIVDFGTNLTGFIGATLTCKRPIRLFFTFDETLSDGDVDFKRLSCVNIIAYELAPGTYQVESLEPYTFRYLKLIVAGGDCEVEKIYLREYANPDVMAAHFASSDERLNRLFDAGRETYRQNAVDIFMDCPSRERAGWLCDSFFTSRVAYALSGNTAVERNFFENFLLPKKFAHLPEGMLPMCYPADHYNGRFIPNWALWFVVQLEEYYGRSGDRQTLDALRPKVMKLFDYFQRFRNQDGLLEDLESWVFIEWSAANKFVQDVNYPTNMLYAAALAAAGRMYHQPALLADAEKIRNVIRKQSFDGEFFVDNAVRKNGTLQVTRNRTEVCQYFAFYFDVASPETHAKLWSVLRDKFGPSRQKLGLYPEIHPANSFIGNMLRMELLSRYGRGQQIVDETRSYLLYMADRTGTLWENMQPSASLDHGFASHVVYTLYRDVLGLYRIDPVNKTVAVRFTDSALDWCEGRVPVPGGAVSLRWRKENGKRLYQLDIPAGWTGSVDDRSGRGLAY
jgi:alpha-L-rhamnosidase